MPRCPLEAAALDGLSAELATWATDAEASVLVDRIAAWERLRSAVAAAQAKQTAAFVAARKQQQRADLLVERLTGTPAAARPELPGTTAA